jgi:hypothetical protein
VVGAVVGAADIGQQLGCRGNRAGGLTATVLVPRSASFHHRGLGATESHSAATLFGRGKVGRQLSGFDPEPSR